MKKPKVSAPKIKIRDLTHDSVPASVGLVKEIRDELRADNRSLGHQLQSVEISLNSKIDSMGPQLQSVELNLNSKVDSVAHSLGSRIDSVEHGLGSRIDSVEHKLQSVEVSLNSKIDSVEHRLNSKIDTVEHRLSSKIEQVLVSVHRTQVLMEEQRGEDRIVLDGLKNLFERQDRIETDVGDLRHTVEFLSAAAKR